jgi:hypothetical protein
MEEKEVKEKIKETLIKKTLGIVDRLAYRLDHVWHRPACVGFYYLPLTCQNRGKDRMRISDVHVKGEMISGRTNISWTRSDRRAECGVVMLKRGDVVELFRRRDLHIYRCRQE